MATTATADTGETGAATTSAPEEPLGGRPLQLRSAAARSEQLYALHHRMVAGLCRALLRDPSEAEDAAQQVFLSAHRSLLNGATPREPAAWLATIARNECWARIRLRMREPLPSQDAEDVAGRDDPVAEALRRADLAALWRAIRALPKQQRDALLLREFGGLHYHELAAALAVSEPAVESLLFRARARLRTQLQSAAAALAPLARLLAGSGGPAVAAKAAALGLGAAAVTGTAVVAPEMLQHRPHQMPPAARSKRLVHPAHAARSATPIAVAQMPIVVHHVRQEHAAVTKTTESERHGGRGATTAEPERHDGEATTTTPTAPTTTTSRSGDGDRRGQTTTLELSGGDGGGSHGSSGSGGSSGSDGPGGDGSDGGGGSDGRGG